MYEINKTGERVRIDVLANVDNSMVGLHIGNSRIISIPFNDLFAIVVKILGEREINHFQTELFKHHALPLQDQNEITVMETTGDVFQAINLDDLKLYKSADVLSCYFFAYKYYDCQIHNGGLGKVYLREHSIYFLSEKYTMTDFERTDFPLWVKAHEKISRSSEQNDKFNKMMRLYLDSYLTDYTELAFTMLTVVLEMLFGSQSEITYRISRGVALFLSNSREEMELYFNIVKRLYSIRSKFVHEGKSIELSSLYELREITRKVIVLMYEKGMDKKEFNFKEFANQITFNGYPQ